MSRRTNQTPSQGWQSQTISLCREHRTGSSPSPHPHLQHPQGSEALPRPSHEQRHELAMAGMGAICGLATHLRAFACYTRCWSTLSQGRVLPKVCRGVSVQQRMPRESCTPKKHRVQDLLLLALCHLGSELRQSLPLSSSVSPGLRHLLTGSGDVLLLSWKTYQALWRKCHTFEMPAPPHTHTRRGGL